MREGRGEGKEEGRSGEERNRFLRASDTQVSVAIIGVGSVVRCLQFSGCGSAYCLLMIKKAS